MSQSKTATKPTSVDPRDLPQSLLWGAGIGLVAFVVEMRSTSTKSVNGVVTECTTMDTAAIVAAIACVICAVMALLQLKERTLRAHPLLVTGLGVALLLLAGLHVLRGIGMVGGPC